MGRRFTNKIDLRCWKEHACVGCGGLYAYQLIRTISGTGRTPEAAHYSAQNALQKAINTATDLQPCPTCGLYQPDMIEQRRSNSLTLVLLVGLGVFAIIVVMRAAHGIQADVATWVLAIACSAFALTLLLINLRNRNSDTEANKRIAAQRVASGHVRYAPGQLQKRIDEFASPGRGMLHLVALFLLLVSVGAIVAPEAVRMSRGWPLNPECYPPVVGPGDTTRIYMSDSISSIKGYWLANAHVTMRDASDPSAEERQVIATTNQNTWGNSISVKSSEKSSRSHPWAEVQVPNDPFLANKVVTCNIQLDLEYPVMEGSHSFNVESGRMRRTTTMRLGPTGAGGEYNRLWWGATAGGVVVSLLCALLLVARARGLAGTANPTRTFV